MRMTASCFVLLVLVARVHAADAGPVKLAVELIAPGARAGQPVPIRVQLLDATNHPVKAPKPFEVLLQARLPSGEVRSLRTASFSSGDSTKELTVTPPAPGLVYLWAKHGELLPGGAFVNVRPASATAEATEAPPRPAVMPKRRLPPVEIARGPLPAPIPPPTPQSAPQLALRFSPDRRFLADGKDAATVQAFLLTPLDSVSSDIRLNLFDSSGTLKPAPLIIPRGQDFGTAALTFNNPGMVTVEYLGSTPTAQLQGERKLQIQFMPPITHIAFEASPPNISLVDTADLVATLVDDTGRPVATDAPRHVTFTIQSGRGDITRNDVEIAAGQFQARSSFQPTSFGQVQVTASTPNLLSVAAPVQVSAPFVLIAASLAGGLLGGYLSYLKRRRSGRRRIGIGLATGFIFYWACIFLGLAALSHGAVVNPLSAFALSTVGGWLQTEVFGMIGSKVKA